MKYDEGYYDSLNYSGYLERQVKYRKTAEDIDDLLRKLCLGGRENVLLDYGCAVGFLLMGFKHLGYNNVYGYDISTWATEASRNHGNQMLDGVQGFKTDILVALDVFEHMRDEDIREVLRETRSKVLVARIPCSTDGGETFHLAVSRNDPTHINCKDKADWIGLLREHYDCVLRIDLSLIYDTDGVACLLGLKT